MTEQLTTRQMLELAAKAAGYDVEYMERCRSKSGPFGLVAHERVRGFVMRGGKAWDPEHNDGDSMRLAANLNLSIQPDDTCVEVTAPDCYAVDGVCPWSIAKYADHNGEKSEAWRLAVLQVAAQIGASMP